ncbi:MAG: tannase/feruloyl esterase family alpha/beta hydrolase [Streptosporangiaceae bacterium]|nr:tannase/feruloyl esterase family alpha/beta hydrolase [Streptosporangiaceae bacterium]
MRRPAVIATAVGLLVLVIQLAGPSSAPALTTVTSARTATIAAIAPVTGCGQLQAMDFTRLAAAPTEITSAATVTINGASYCEVKGEQAPELQFDLRLPVSTWTGRYIQEGCGGYCGAVSPGAPAVATNCPAVTGNELALATDNEGHVGASGFDALWAAADPAMRISYAYSSEHDLALAAKAIIAAYYGQGPSNSYFDGCSDGGREAMVEAERYPHDFNGILAGAPEIIASELNGEVQAWNILSNMDAQGHEILTAEKLPALHAAVMKACAGPQGYITDPRACDFSPASIQCPAGQDNDGCLTPAQVAVAVKLYQGPRDARGQSLYPGGEPYGAELAWTGWLIDPASDAAWPKDTIDYSAALGMLKYIAFATNPPASFTLTDWSFSLADYQRLTALNGLNDATDPDLSAFARAGGKLIIYHGWADSAISPFGTVQYYSAVVRDAGGFAASQAFSRLYMIPAQYHCLGGGTPQVTGDLLTPLMNWVEQGAAPAAQTFSVVNPATSLKTITVSPFDPDVTPPGSGLNSSYPWVGGFRTGTELWCTVDGMNVTCRRGE